MNHQFEPRLASQHRRRLNYLHAKAADDDEEDTKETKVVVKGPTTTATTTKATPTPSVIVLPSINLPLPSTTIRVLPSTSSTSTPVSTSSIVKVVPSVSLTPSTTAVAPPSTTSNIIPTTSSIPPGSISSSVTPTSSSILRNIGSITTSAASPSSSSNTTSASSNGSEEESSNTGAIAGGIVGGLVGFVALCAFVAFLVRHLRKRRESKDRFNANQFRRSALLLDDDKSAKASTRSPRPPSMIERRAAASPAVPAAPSLAYGPHSDQVSQYGGSEYSHYGAAAAGPGVAGMQYGAPAQDLYGTTPGRYGTPNPGPYGGAPVAQYNMHPQVEQYPALDPYAANMAAYNGGHSGYGSYGAADPRYARPAQQYPQYNNVLPNHSYGYGPNAAQSMAPQPQQNEPFPSPFTVAPVPPTAQTASPPPTNPSAQEPYVRRQNSLTHLNEAHDADVPPPAYVDDGSYTNVQRDVKVRPKLAVSNGENDGAGSSSSQPAAVSSSNERRPASSHTVYDPADAYGGM